MMRNLVSMAATVTAVGMMCFLGIFSLADGLERNPSMESTMRPSLTAPDLTVTMQTKTIFYQGQDGTTCVDFRPGTVVVTNNGTGTASGFDIAAEWNMNGQFSLNTMLPNNTLGPGGVKPISWDQPANAYTWCPVSGQPAPAWRVTVDYGNKVVESNEGNNTVEKTYRQLTAPMKEFKPLRKPAGVH